MANRDVKGFIVVVLNIWETLILGMGVFRILHPRDMHDHSIDDLHFPINLGVEGVVDLVSLVSISDHRIDQNVPKNLLSRFEMVVYGSPKLTHTHSKKRLTVASMVMLFLQAVNMAILEKRSTTTNTQSLPSLVKGSLDM